MENSSHKPVLLEESIDALKVAPNGSYVDGTFGRGGHSSKILERLSTDGRLLVIDKDADAIAYANSVYGDDKRVEVIHGSFADLLQYLRACGLAEVDGVLLDLGVSSPQLENEQRGFSFMKDGPLDMRMDQTTGVTAARWLASASHPEIARVLRELGEERFALRIASKIVERRETGSIDTTAQLVDLIEDAIPFKDKNKHPATRSFLALRMYINNELIDLTRGLREVVSGLARGGRIVVITFHSLEDRLVKRFFRDLEKADPYPRKLPVRDAELIRSFRVVGRPRRPSVEEIQANPRARSAMLRVVEKVA